MRVLTFLAAGLCALGQAQGVPTVAVAPVEVWMHRPSVAFPAVHSESGITPNTWGSNPVTTAVHAKGLLDVEGLKWEDGAIHIGSLKASLQTTELKCELTSPIPAQIFSFPNVRIDIASRAPMVLKLPARSTFKPEVTDGKVRWVPAGDTFKKEMAAQVDSLFADGTFDRHFTIELKGDLSDLARKEGPRLLSLVKPALLAQAREALKKWFEGEDCLKSLVGGMDIPASLVAALPSEWEWVQLSTMQRTPRGMENAVLWKFAPVGSRSAYRLPAVGVERNAVSWVITPAFLQSRLEAGFESETLELEGDAAKSAAMLLGTDAKLELVTRGERGPRVRVWSRAGQGMYIDLLWCFRNEAGEEFPIGLVLGPTVEGRKLVGAFVKKKGAWGPVAEKDLELVNQIAESRLAPLTLGPEGKPVVERVLGSGQVRANGEAWAEAIALDLIK